MTYPDSAKPNARPLHVLKFGGTAMGSADTLRQTVSIVCEEAARRRLVVVVSALSGVTDGLARAADVVCSRKDVRKWIAQFEARHRTLAGKVLSGGYQARYAVFRRVHLSALERALAALARKGPSPARRDAVLAAGERLSAPLLALALQQEGHRARVVDGPELIRTDAGHGAANVEREVTARRTRDWHRQHPAAVVPVVTGFTGQAATGAVTTLGRGGSDYTAALIASALGADRLVRWTDTDGLYTHDPNRDPRAEPIERIVLDRAAAWNRAGRLGMHRKALDPLVEAQVPATVRSIAAPNRPGTEILPQAHPASPEAPPPAAACCAGRA